MYWDFGLECLLLNFSKTTSGTIFYQQSEIFVIMTV